MYYRAFRLREKHFVKYYGDFGSAQLGEGAVSRQGFVRLFKDEELAFFRGNKLGFVFQFHHLLGEFTVLENITHAGSFIRKTEKAFYKESGIFSRNIGAERIE